MKKSFAGKEVIVFLIIFPVLLLGVASARERIIISSAAVSEVSVRDFEVNDKVWTLLKELRIPTPGPVGTTALTMPTVSQQFDLYYTYEQENEAKLRQVRLDLETFEVLRDRALPKYGSDYYGVLVHGLSSSSKQRFGYYTGENLLTRNLRPNGNLGAGKSRIFENDNLSINVSGSINWQGNVATEVIFFPTNQTAFLDFRSLNNSGKPAGNPVRYSLNGNLLNVSLSAVYNSGIAPHYFTAFREFRSSGSTEKTGVFLQQLDTNHFPIGNAIKINGFRATKFLDVFVFNTTVIYDDWVIFGREDSCGKITMSARRFNTETGKPIGKRRVLIKCNDPLLDDVPFVYGYAAVGFQYDSPPSVP